MKFGIREAVDIAFKALAPMTLGSVALAVGEPALYFESCKVSTFEGTSATVYATGGPGSPRLIAWEGEKNIVFTFEEALLSMESLALLTGAGLVNASGATPATKQKSLSVTLEVQDGGLGDDYVEYDFTVILGSDSISVGTDINAVVADANAVQGTLTSGNIYQFTTTEAVGAQVPVTFVFSVDTLVLATPIIVHKKSVVYATVAGGSFSADLTDELNSSPIYDSGKVFGFVLDSAGDIITRLGEADSIFSPIVNFTGTGLSDGTYPILLDYYVSKESNVQQVEIKPNVFAGYFYIEADTLFRRQSDGVDMPAHLVIPKGKVQTAFSFSMSPTGDPSTFTFTVDAMPGRIVGGPANQKLLSALQVESE